MNYDFTTCACCLFTVVACAASTPATSGVPPDAIVGDLSDTEREQLCEWTLARTAEARARGPIRCATRPDFFMPGEITSVGPDPSGDVCGENMEYHEFASVELYELCVAQQASIYERRDAFLAECESDTGCLRVMGEIPCSRLGSGCVYVFGP